jgi:glucokinase
VVAELTEKLRGVVTVPLADDFSIQTFNDATAFAFGEYPERQAENFKGAYFTLGTGCGSTFIENGQMIRKRMGIPISGMIYDCPFKASIIDDYISARGLAKIIFAVCGEERPAPLVYEQAKAGQAEALLVFQHFGQSIGQALAPFVAQFLPDELIFGGQISKSFLYMQPSLLAELKVVDFKGQLRVAADTSFSTILGLKNLAKRRKAF